MGQAGDPFAFIGGFYFWEIHLQELSFGELVSINLLNWRILLKYGLVGDYLDLKIFRCLTYAYTNDWKLGPRALKCIFISYA